MSIPKPVRLCGIRHWTIGRGGSWKAGQTGRTSQRKLPGVRPSEMGESSKLERKGEGIPGGRWA